MKTLATACLLCLMLCDTASAQFFRRLFGGNRSNVTRRSSGVSQNGSVTRFYPSGGFEWTDSRGRKASYSGACCDSDGCEMRRQYLAALENERSQRNIPSSAIIQPTGTQYEYVTEMVPVYCNGRICRYEQRTKRVPVAKKSPVTMQALAGEISSKDQLESEARKAAMEAVKLNDVPTPQGVIEAIFDIWQLPANSYLCEPCAGSAPFLREGIRQGFDGWGVELNPETARETNLSLERGLVLEGDVHDYDFSNADAVFLYAYKPEAEHVISTLRPGCRVATYQNPPPGIDAQKIEIELDGKSEVIYLGVKS